MVVQTTMVVAAISGRIIELEETQKEDLKRNQYAWHCQFCLAEHSPEQLAPAKSYAEIKENRSQMIEAHHADQVNAGGARHAGNIIISCSYHHDYLGDRLSRAGITAGLKNTAVNYEIVFKTHDKGDLVEKIVSGKIITVNIFSPNESVKCFFTDWHSKYWLIKEGLR